MTEKVKTSCVVRVLLYDLDTRDKLELNATPVHLAFVLLKKVTQKGMTLKTAALERQSWEKVGWSPQAGKH